MMPPTLKNLIRITPLGLNFYWRIKLALFMTVLFVKRRLRITSRPEYFFRLTKFGKPFACYLTDESDLQTLSAVFSVGEYEIEPRNTPNTIVDLGSNIGLTLIYFSLRFPSARIYGFEPNPRIFKRLKKNVSGYQSVRIFQYALGGKEGTRDFYVDKKKSVSSSLKKRREANERVLVETKTLCNIREECAGGRIDLLKFDIEGAELELFTNCDCIRGIQTIIGEVHTDLTGVGKAKFCELFAGYDIRTIDREKERFILRASMAKKKYAKGQGGGRSI